MVKVIQPIKLIAPLMLKTRLQHRKEEWGCKTDGETLLLAAEEGISPDIHLASEKKQNYLQLLKDLGIMPAHDRNQIAACLASHLAEDSVFEEAAKKLAQQRISELSNVEVLPGVKRPDLDKKAIAKEALARTRLVLSSVFNFCEYEMAPNRIENFERSESEPLWKKIIKAPLKFLLGKKG